MTDRSPDDLTARARIRDAAIQLFAERGIAAATIRDIAQAAGVSSGLVRHHFGSKEALRDVCDAYAKERLDRLREEVFSGGNLADPGFLVARHPTMRLMQRYLLQSMMDGSPAAGAMFAKMVELGEEWFSKMDLPIRDIRAYSAVVCAMQMGVYLMQDQLSQVLGVDMNTTEGYVRVNHGIVDAAAHAMLTREQADQLHAAMDQLLETSPKE